MIRVLIADDHPVMRNGLAALLGSLPDIEVVAVVADGRDAVREVVLMRPDVALLDLQMCRGWTDSGRSARSTGWHREPRCAC